VNPKRVYRLMREPLKYEEVYRNEYRDLAEARAAIGEFLEKVGREKSRQTSGA
jgi:hypothetical protein